MNFSGISNRSLVGRLLRFPLTLLPDSTRMPILQGPLKGWRWIVGAGNHGYWLGSYEQAKTQLFARAVHSGDVVYDVGANVGYYTLLAAAAAGRSGRVIAFEPLPDNLKYLHSHIDLNRLKQVEVFEAAVSNQTGETFFEVAANRSMGQIAGHGTLRVQLVTLDELVAAARIPPPNCMKIDVEGAELQVLAGARNILAQAQPDIYLAVHSQSLHRACCQLLVEAGYQLSSMDGKPVDETDEIYATCK